MHVQDRQYQPINAYLKDNGKKINAKLKENSNDNDNENDNDKSKSNDKSKDNDNEYSSENPIIINKENYMPEKLNICNRLEMEFEHFENSENNNNQNNLNERNDNKQESKINNIEINLDMRRTLAPKEKYHLDQRKKKYLRM